MTAAHSWRCTGITASLCFHQPVPKPRPLLRGIQKKSSNHFVDFVSFFALHKSSVQKPCHLKGLMSVCNCIRMIVSAAQCDWYTVALLCSDSFATELWGQKGLTENLDELNKEKRIYQYSTQWYWTIYGPVAAVILKQNLPYPLSGLKDDINTHCNCISCKWLS